MKEVKELFAKEFDVVFNGWIECYNDSEVIEELNNGKADTVKKINKLNHLKKYKKFVLMFLQKMVVKKIKLLNFMLEY